MQGVDGDSEELSEEPTSRFQILSAYSVVAQQRENGHSKHGTAVVYELKNPTALEMRRLKRLLRYVKGTEDMSTVFEMRDSNDRREQLVKRLEVYTDS